MRRVSACADTVSTQVDTQPKALRPRIHSLEMWVIVSPQGEVGWGRSDLIRNDE